MLVSKVIERAEKFRLLGRFDKKSAIDYINDAMYEISKRQSLKIEEDFYSFQVNPIRLANKLIKLDSVDFGTTELNLKYAVRVMQNNELWVYKKDEEDGNFDKISFDNENVIERINLIYIGHRVVTSADQNVDFPSEMETAIVYFLRSKMLEEIGEIEISQYFNNQFDREIIRKSSPKVDVVSKPSEFSLL